MNISVVIPFYRQPSMLRKQLENWSEYTQKAREHFTLIVIDDGSPEPAVDIIKPTDGVQLYRIGIDKPWNRNGARNLGAHVCETMWLLNVDIDHVLPPSSADALIKMELDPKLWYRFQRWRVGKADETRQKDKSWIPDDCELGQVKPHIDSHLMTRELFMRSPYDEEYSGFLGGGSPFLKRMEEIANVSLLPDDVRLHVYTRHAIPDASVNTLSRDTSQYSKLRKEKERTGNIVPKDLLRFPWARVL